MKSKKGQGDFYPVFFAGVSTLLLFGLIALTSYESRRPTRSEVLSLSAAAIDSASAERVRRLLKLYTEQHEALWAAYVEEHKAQPFSKAARESIHREAWQNAMRMNEER